METYVSWSLLVIGMVGAKVINFNSAKYFDACFELLTTLANQNLAKFLTLANWQVQIENKRGWN